MARLVLFLFALLVPAESLRAQVEGHRILFGDSTAVSEADQRAIYEQFGYTVSADGAGLDVVDCGTIYVNAVEALDLNGDGVDEVFVDGGNTCTSGHAGSSVVLFIKDAEGRYAPHLGFPAFGWDVLETSNLGFPDLALGGPGFCRPVWRWDGATYQHERNEPTEPGGCDGIGSR